jgi:hypothetical protein
VADGVVAPSLLSSVARDAAVPLLVSVAPFAHGQVWREERVARDGRAVRLGAGQWSAASCRPSRSRNFIVVFGIAKALTNYGAGGDISRVVMSPDAYGLRASTESAKLELDPPPA